MTVNDKRRVVVCFKAGWSMTALAKAKAVPVFDIECVIRNYMNGRFQLQPEDRPSPSAVIRSIEVMTDSGRRSFVAAYNGPLPKGKKKK